MDTPLVFVIDYGKCSNRAKYVGRYLFRFWYFGKYADVSLESEMETAQVMSISDKSRTYVLYGIWCYIPLPFPLPL